jgi:hypothetical protein
MIQFVIEKLALVDDFRTFEWEYPEIVYRKSQEFLQIDG